LPVLVDSLSDLFFLRSASLIRGPTGRSAVRQARDANEQKRGKCCDLNIGFADVPSS
jgi:hypothetical protein